MTIIKIIKATTEDTKQLFMMTHAVKAGKLSELEGQTVEPQAWVLYEDTDKNTGELKTVLCFRLPDGAVYGTVSKTFIDIYMDMVQELGELEPFEVMTGTTKSGRTFIYPIPC